MTNKEIPSGSDTFDSAIELIATDIIGGITVMDDVPHGLINMVSGVVDEFTLIIEDTSIPQIPAPDSLRQRIKEIHAPHNPYLE